MLRPGTLAHGAVATALVTVALALLAVLAGAPVTAAASTTDTTEDAGDDDPDDAVSTADTADPDGDAPTAGEPVPRDDDLPAVEVDPLLVTVIGGAGRTELRPSLPPGGTARRALSVTNTADVEVEVDVVSADATRTDSGLDVGDGSQRTGVGGWTTVTPGRLTIAPGEAAAVEVEVRRPADDTEGGVGAVVVQLAEASRTELGRTTVRRAAVPVVVTADGSGDGLRPDAVSWDPAGPTGTAGAVTLTVTNTTTGTSPLRAVVTDGDDVVATVTGEDLASGEQRTVEVPLDEGARLVGWTLVPTLLTTDDSGGVAITGGASRVPALVCGLTVAAAAVAAGLSARREQERGRPPRSRQA